MYNYPHRLRVYYSPHLYTGECGIGGGARSPGSVAARRARSARSRHPAGRTARRAAAATGNCAIKLQLHFRCFNVRLTTIRYILVLYTAYIQSCLTLRLTLQ